METAAIETLLADDRFVRRLARRLVRDAATADDLAQEAYVEAIVRRPRGDASLRGWVSAVLRHLASNRRRGDARRARREGAAARPEAQAPETLLLEREEVRQRLVSAVLALGAPRSTVLILRYLEGLPPRAISRRLGMETETVRSHLKRGLAELRRRLGAERRDGESAFAALPLLLARPHPASIAIGVAAMTAKTKVALVAAAALLAVSGLVTMKATERRGNPETPVSRTDSGGAIPAGEPGARPEEPVARTPLAAAATQGPATRASGTSRTCVLRGVVLDPDGAPVAGAFVEGRPSAENARSIDEAPLLQRMIRGAGGPQPGTRPAAAFDLRSGADGTFEVSGLAPSDSHDVAAWTDELGVVVVRGVPVRAERPAEVTLRFARGVVLYGVITGPDGAPIPTASVDLMGTPDEKVYSSLLFLPVREDGSWRTPPLARKGFMVSSRAPGFRSGHKNVSWDPSGPREVRLDFRLEPAPLLRGRFVRPDGAPARLEESLRERGIDPRDSAVAVFATSIDPATDPNFRELFRTSGTIAWADDRWEIVAEQDEPSFVSLWCGTTLLGAAKVTPGEEVDLPVRLEGAICVRNEVPVELVVVDEAGAPAPGATGRLRLAFEQGSGRAGLHWPLVAVENRPGVLRAERVPAGALEARVAAAGFVPRRVPLAVEDAAGPASFTVALARATHRVEVTVRTLAGEPVPGATIHAIDSAGQVVDLGGRVATNLEGRAALTGLGEGSYEFLATPERFAPASARVWVNAGLGEVPIAVREAEEVRFDVEGGDGPFSFRFVDGAGVTVFDDACIDAKRYGGKGMLFRLAPGRHTATVRCPGFAPAEATFDVATGTRVAIPLSRASR